VRGKEFPLTRHGNLCEKGPYCSGFRLSAAKEKARIGEFALLIPVSQVEGRDRFAADYFHRHLFSKYR
jgi:hypothetical protein